jgi:molybdopterin converting factor subunit 1
MRVNVLFFGVLKDLAGKSSDVVDLRDDATVADVLAHYEARIPQLGNALPSLAIAVNQQYAEPDTTLKESDEIALLPPVSGGAPDGSGGTTDPSAPPREGSRPARRRWAAVVRDPIDTQGTLASLKRGEDGAVLVFEGVVRNQTRGRNTLYLDYEAYEEMALREMESLASQALHRFQIRDVALVHRLGRLEIGETSVLIAVVSAHRAAAFDACRWLIDMLKRTVPIWKKEYFDDGAVWADGEPFPAEIPRANSSEEGSPGEGPASK